MRVYELLMERASSVLYHYTNIKNALDILITGKFELSSVIGSVEDQFTRFSTKAL